MFKKAIEHFKDSSLYPKVFRDYYYLKQLARYIRLSISGADAWREVLSKPPKSLGLNLTGTCNARCVYCAYPFHKPDGVMEMNIFKKAVEDFISMGGQNLGFSPVTGDPFTDPKLIERLEWLSKIEQIKSLFFTTNGIALSKSEIVDQMIQYTKLKKIHIGISMPGFEKERFERVFAVSGYEKTLQGIHYLVKSNKEAGYPLEIKFPLQPDCGGVLRDKDYLTMIAPFVRSSDVFVIPRIANNWCGQITQKNLTGDMVMMRNLPLRKIPCHTMLEGTIDILTNGDVRVCGCTYGKDGKHDALVIGNIMKDSLDKIWYGHKFAKICEAFTKGKSPAVCRNCAMYIPHG